MDWLASELGVTPPEAEALAVGVILDGRLPGASIDQVQGVLTLRATGAAAPFGQEMLAQATANAAAAAVASGKAAASSSSSSAASPSTSASDALYCEVQRLAGRLEGLIGTLTAGAMISQA